MEGRGRGRGRGERGRGRGDRGGGRGRGESGGGRGRGDSGGGRGRGESGGGRGYGDSGRGDRGGYGGGWGQQSRDEPRGQQFPSSREGGYGGGWGQQSRDEPRGQQFPSSRDGRESGSSSRYERGSGDQGPRQRDGDWTCSGCGFNNFAKNHQCYKCRTDKSGSGASGGSEGQRGGWGGRDDGQRGRGRDDGGYQRGGRGGGRGRGDWGRGGRGGGGGGRGGDRGAEIDWAAQEEMETASQSSSHSDPAAEAAKRLALLALNDLPTALAGEDKNKYSIIPHRINKGPKVGTRGKQITIEVNHLKLTYDPKKTVAIYYDCAFKPDKLSRKVLRKIMAVVRDKCYPTRNPAFDGKKNLYSCGEIPLFKGKELHETVELPPEDGDSKPLKVEVTIKEVEGESRIDLSLIAKYMQRQITEYPQKAVQVMEIVLRSAPATAGFTQVGRSFFTAPRQSITLGNGLELYHGFFQSVVLGWEVFLNVDVAHKGFPEGRVVSDVMCDFKNTGRNPKPYPKDLRFNFNELESFKKFIKGLRVAYAIPNIPTSRRKFTVIGVKPPADKFTFNFKRNDNDAGRVMTIEQYFRQEKRYNLQYPHLPLLHVGDPKRNVCLPPELCTIVVGQVMMKKLDSDQTRAMIREAAKPPDDRKQKIENAMRAANFNQNGCVKEFGLNVGQQFTRVPARILNPPDIVYNQTTAQPRNGEWQGKSFKQAVSLDRWAIASFSSQCGINELRQVIDRLKQVSGDAGVMISEPYRIDTLVQDRYMSDADINRTLLQAFQRYKEDNAQLVVTLITDKLYSMVKKTAEITVGLLTQCILDKTMRRMDASTAKNILLKVNAKLNGVNHTVTRSPQDRLPKGSDKVIELLRGTMLMGADVTHPSPDQKEIPSVAAVTASHDPLQFQYNMVWRLQPPKQEIIGDLHNIVIKQLRFYKAKNNGRDPERIIFYRDGVSEGQFIQVLQVEMTCIKWACRKELGKDLPVTFLVVQKRHHTRFFPTSRDHMDRKGNVPPGTVVDTNITHPLEADFYMVSHASLQGTSRPTKYHKLWDDNQINEDDLEELTFFLCHMFSRCTRSVSYPAPTYYAHLGAARGRVYLEGSRINIEELGREMEQRTIQANIVNGSPMFFT